MTLWRGQLPLILASQSRARQLLLANAGIEFKAVPAEIDERSEQKRSGLTLPGDIAALLAREKARSVSIGHPGHYVAGADAQQAVLPNLNQALRRGMQTYHERLFDRLQLMRNRDARHQRNVRSAYAAVGEIN